MNPLARLEITRTEDGRVLAALVGEIDLSNADVLERQLDDAIGDAAAVEIDLTAVDYIDSQGVRILHRLADRHAQGALSLTIVAAAESFARDILEITRLTDTVPVVAPGA